jgi:hypothetical protein
MISPRTVFGQAAQLARWIVHPIVVADGKNRQPGQTFFEEPGPPDVHQSPLVGKTGEGSVFSQFPEKHGSPSLRMAPWGGAAVYRCDLSAQGVRRL